MGMPWSLHTQATSTGGSSGAGGSGGSEGTAIDARPAACTSSPTSDGKNNLSCVGTAQISGSPSAPKLIFDDSSELDYDLAQVPTLGFPALGNGRVSVQYNWRQVMDCPFCGSRSEVSVEIRTLDGGQLLYAEWRSGLGNGIQMNILAEVLGVTPVAERGCSYRARQDCYSFERTEYDYTAPTTPPLRLPHRQVTRWHSPTGVDYDMMVSSSADSDSRREPNCMDGGEIASDSSFLVLRVTE
jgi:hypothetical protein